ncbi:MAG: 50S ribosomal protein L18 [Bdellovibrionales bacterium]|nr:50S ribosomal protein L18 [Bdellovibrionales bacterium]
MGKTINKISPRERRKFRIRARIVGTADRPRVSVFRSDKCTYAQVISDESGTTLLSASTKDADVQSKIGSVKDERENASGSSKSVKAAKGLGLIIAEKCAEKGIKSVVFDRNGFLFHGRVKALADGLREGGLTV